MATEKNGDQQAATAATTAAAAAAADSADSATTTTEPAGAPAVAPPAKVDTSKMSTVDILRSKKEERDQRQSRAANTTTTKPHGSESTPAAAAADNGAGAEADLGKDTNGGGDVSDDAAVVKSIDMAKPGWFDRLKPEQREALERTSPETIRLANAGKAEAQRYVERAKQKVATATPATPAKETTPTDDKETKASASAHAQADLSEAIDLLYDEKTKKKGLTMLLSDPDAAEIIDARVVAGVKSALQQLGVDIDAQVALRPLSDAIELASSKYPQLKSDDEFFNEVDAELREDEETYEALMQEKNPRLIAAAIREASANVVRSRAATKATTATKATPAAAPVATPKQGIGAKERRENLERNTQAARDAAGVKAGAAGSRTGGTQAAEAESTVELLRRQRQGKDYRFIGA